MKQQDPTKFRDPMPQFKFAGGAAIIGVFLLIAEAPIAGLAFLLAIIWVTTGLFRYAKIKRWLKQNPPAEPQATAPPSTVSIGEESSEIPIPTPQDPPILDSPKSNRKLIVVTGVTALALIAALGLKAATENPFEAALKNCGVTNNATFPEFGAGIADKGKTLFLHNKGEADDFGLASMASTGCILNELDAPLSVTGQIEGTRALDGRQTATWGKFTVTWSFHPDTNLDLIITR